MADHKQKCACSKKVRAPQLGNCKQLISIVRDLTADDVDVGPSLAKKIPRHRLPPPRRRHSPRTCVPMTPSMHTRLQLRGGHCEPFPHYHNRWCNNPPPPMVQALDMGEKSTKEENKDPNDKQPCPINMPVPPRAVTHSDSTKSLLRVGSPKVSGEVLCAEKASLTPREFRAPVPSRRAYQVHKPRSGLYVNVTDDFVPEFEGGSAAGCRGRRRRHHLKSACKKTCPGRKRHQSGRHVCRRKTMGERTTGQNLKGRYIANVGKEDKTRTRFERSTQKYFVDDDSACSAEIISPANVKIPHYLKKGMLQTHSLTVMPCPNGKKTEMQFGILTGTINMFDNKFSARSKGQQAITISVMAYCFAFHCHPKQWTVALIDNLVDSGDKWYLQRLDALHDHSAVQGICEVLPFGKKHILILNGKKMLVLLYEPDIVGYTMSLDPTVYNLHRGLEAFFQINNAGIFLSKALKLVIWKDKICYYIFDPAGRNERAKNEGGGKSGKAALMNVKDIESVVEVVLARSTIKDQKYVLAALRVLRMVDESSLETFASDHDLTPAEKAMAEYRILGETCAIVNGNYHLGDACFEEARYRQALPIAVIAMAYSKVSPPNTWNSKSIDKILRLGSKLYMDCTNPKALTDLTVDNIPMEIQMGPYTVEIIIHRSRVKGHLFTKKDCILDIEKGILEFFNKQYLCGIIQFNIYAVAIWKQREMYYIYDPYPCANDGLKSPKGKACVLMHLNPQSMGEMFRKTWEYLPSTTQFSIHAFKVLKLDRHEFKTELCILSDAAHKKAKVKTELEDICSPHGDGPEDPPDPDITSLVDTIVEDDVPPIPLKYKYAEPAPVEEKMVDLDSPTVSATQIVPARPLPRDKTGEPPEPDPDPEPEPVEPPKEEKGEGGGAEEETGEEEQEAEEESKEKEKEKEKEVELKEEELPPPPPSPEPEPELAVETAEDEAQTMRADVVRKVLLTTDGRLAQNLIKQRKVASQPLDDTDAVSLSPSQELLHPSEFKDVPDGTQIISAASAISGDKAEDILPFVSIMAIITSYKYKINTWNKYIVDFVMSTGRRLYDRKQQRFQFAPVHVIPKVAIGSQAFATYIEVKADAPTWQLESILQRFFTKHNRCMITTSNYSCAVFVKNGLYYLFDGSPLNPVGLRVRRNGKGAFMRFAELHGVVHRILFNKDANKETQQFVLSRLLVRRLERLPRERLPDDPCQAPCKAETIPDTQSVQIRQAPFKPVGYYKVDGVCRIRGTTALGLRMYSSGVRQCHFINIIAMLTLALHPLRTWDARLIDATLERGMDIYNRACNRSLCELRVIRNILMEGYFFNVNIRRIMVVNHNVSITIDQYLRAILAKMRYVMITYQTCSMVLYREGDYMHVFDPYPAPSEAKGGGQSDGCEVDDCDELPEGEAEKGVSSRVASWTLYKNLDEIIERMKKTICGRAVHNPTFYTYELTSVRRAPKHALFNYKLSPLFKADADPMQLPRKRKRPLRVLDEKICWTFIKNVPWARTNAFTDLGYRRKTPRTLWKDWDIEYPGDLYSLFGTVSPMSTQFDEENRGKQMLAINTVALAMTKYYQFSEWTPNVVDAIVCYGDRYHSNSVCHIKDKNHQLTLEDLDKKFDMFPYSFSVKFNKVIFGVFYSIQNDVMNLSKALVYFFENNKLGMLLSSKKNMSFGLIGKSYFMFECQSYGAPLFAPRCGGGYVLKCESLNRLLFCMIVALDLKTHGIQFDLYAVYVDVAPCVG